MILVCSYCSLICYQDRVVLFLCCIICLVQFCISLLCYCGVPRLAVCINYTCCKRHMLRKRTLAYWFLPVVLSASVALALSYWLFKVWKLLMRTIYSYSIWYIRSDNGSLLVEFLAFSYFNSSSFSYWLRIFNFWICWWILSSKFLLV